MKKICAAITVILAMMLCAASAMGWGSATHAYIGERLNNKGPLLTLNQVYGAMAGDVFNLMSNPDYRSWLSTRTHCPGRGNMWSAAYLPTAKALAYGLISHNQAWGADFFAHDYSCPDNYPPRNGYIQDKAEYLFPLLKDTLYGYLDNLPLNRYQKRMLAMELLRNVIEYAVDILITRQDPRIGAKISYAALLRSPEFPVMLNSTYASGFAGNSGLPLSQAKDLIRATELQFRMALVGYGRILELDEVEAIPQISEQLANLAGQLFGISVTPVSVQEAIVLAMTHCSYDYMQAINRTIHMVRIRMGAHGFIY